MTDPAAERESSPPDSDTADRDSPECNLSWHNVRAKLAEEYPDRITQSDVARILLISVTGVKYHLEHLGDIEVVQIGGRTFRTFDRKTVEKYAKSRTRYRISKCKFQGIEVERLERICETYVRQNLDIAPPELLALAKRIAKL